MKKYSVKLAGLVLFFATGAASGMERPLDTNIKVYVVNKAVGLGGKQYMITIRAEPDLMSTQMGLEPFEEKKVPFGSPVYVNKLNQIADVETSGDYATGWTSNRDMLNIIKKEAIKMNYANANVYLHVISSGTGYYINTWHWAEQAQARFNELIEYIPLADIKKGALGPDYAQKVTEICNADYTKAVAVGYANLCKDLERRLKTDVLKGAPSEIKTREEAIKNIIDGLYAKLQMYKRPMGPNRTVFVR